MTSLLLRIPNPCQRRHFDTQNALKKVQIQNSRSFQNVSFTHGSIVEHLRIERGNFVQSTISQNWLLCFRRFRIYVEDDIFYTLNTLKNVQSRISRSFQNLSYSNGSIVEHLKKEKDNFVQSTISQNWLLCFRHFQIQLKDDILIH